MAGFLDATAARLHRVPAASGRPAVVLPSYNGARRLPVSHAAAGEGGWHAKVCRCRMHGTATEASRVAVPEVLRALGLEPLASVRPIADGEAVFLPTEVSSPLSACWMCAAWSVCATARTVW